jgi:sulfur-oxidizing protein SoxA
MNPIRILRLAAIAGAACLALQAGAQQGKAVKHDYWPGMENAVPHVSGDRKLTNTYDDWKDAESIRRAKAAGKQSRDVNFKDFRWLEKSLDAELVAQEGRDNFHEKNAEGKSCAGCHGEEGAKIKGVLAGYPKYSKAAGRVIVLETAISQCAERHLKRKDWHEDTRANNMISMWLAILSDGYEIKVDMKDPRIKASYERGKELFFRRTGHFHFACAACHTPPTTSLYLRGQRTSGYYGDAAEYPIYHFPNDTMNEDRGFIFTLQHQIRSCQKLSRMYYGAKEGSPSLTDIETFLRASSNGYRISAPVKEYNIDADYLLEQQRAAAK